MSQQTRQAEKRGIPSEWSCRQLLVYTPLGRNRISFFVETQVEHVTIVISTRSQSQRKVTKLFKQAALQGPLILKHSWGGWEWEWEVFAFGP